MLKRNMSVEELRAALRSCHKEIKNLDRRISLFAKQNDKLQQKLLEQEEEIRSLNADVELRGEDKYRGYWKRQ